jgi:hypothetical protein
MIKNKKMRITFIKTMVTLMLWPALWVNAQNNNQEAARMVKRTTPFSFSLLKFSDPEQRMENGNGNVEITGEMKQWHKLTLTLDGPFAHELDNEPNPFTDYRMTVRFVHESGSPVYEVPGYFAADGNAANTGADSGTRWRAHLSPDKIGNWTYEISFLKGELVAVIDVPYSKKLLPYDGAKGGFTVSSTDKTGRDFRGKGRLEYVGKHHLQFKGTGEYFLKAGTDAPETFLAYAEFDATYTGYSDIWDRIIPAKFYREHISDWKEGDPVWQGNKGKGIIGALNYLSFKGVNAFSFLTYNAGGDGDNVWPFIERNQKYKYDCSKLDQWQIVFDHAQSKGLYLHFKTQETENDDDYYPGTNQARGLPYIVESLDGGDLGPQRRLYYRELIARFSYLLALNWNLGEENSQTTQQRKDMAQYFYDIDPYRHNIVIHTYPSDGQDPNQPREGQDKVYMPLLGNNSKLTGVSLQNEWSSVHKLTLKWLNESKKAGKPWIVANDEQNPANTGVPPDPGFGNYEDLKYTIHDIRKQTLWGNIMAGGAGVEYYFGNRHPDSDMLSENYRSRDKSWDYCAIALNFFNELRIPFWEMTNRNSLIFNNDNNRDKYCLAKDGEIYLVYLGYVPTVKLDMNKIKGSFSVKWFDPRNGGNLQDGNVTQVKGGGVIDLGNPPADSGEDWLIVIRKI